MGRVAPLQLAVQSSRQRRYSYASPLFVRYARSGAGQTRQRGLDGGERLAETRHRVGVGEAQVAFAMDAERSAGEAGHAGLLQQILSGLTRREAKLLDTGEGIEGA